MNLFVDADASPVLKDAIEIARNYKVPVFVIKSYAHYSHDPFTAEVEVIYVDAEKDAADFAISSRARAGDVVITQDYGLASICLAKGCQVLHHKGFLYTDHNIDRLLAIRHANAKARRAGKKSKGPKAFSQAERQKFRSLLQSILRKQ